MIMVKKPILIKKKRFFDDRGFFQEIYLLRELKIKIRFTAIAHSKKNVIRGLHFQRTNPQGKFITVVHGEILDVVVDLRKNSNTYGKHFSIKISQNSNFSLFIPENFAHGFLCLSKNCGIYYKCTKYRDKNSETTIKWNDTTLGIKWPIKKPILSKKDKEGISFIDFK